jgi:hypothetical protein
MNIQAATIFDELAFDEFDCELQELIRRLVRSGYLGSPLHVEDLLDDEYDKGFERGFDLGEESAKDKLEDELEQILCSKCFDAVSYAS